MGDTPMDTMVSTITAKDLLSPPLLLNPDTVTVTVALTDTDTPMLIMVTTVTITAKGLLKLSPITVTVMLLMPTMVTVMVMVMVMVIMVMASKFILLSFLSNYYNGCVYKKFYDSENFDLRSTVPEVESLAYSNEILVMLSVILCRFFNKI